MGFKLTKKVLRKIVLQEVKKITEGAWEDEPDEPDEPDEEEEDEPWDDPDVEPTRLAIDRPANEPADPSYEHEIPPEELTGLLGWAKSKGFEPDEW